MALGGPQRRTACFGERTFIAFAEIQTPTGLSRRKERDWLKRAAD